jgi:hypothetical protein
MNKVQLDYAKLDNIIIMTFNFTGMKYCIASPAYEHDEKENKFSDLFKVFSSVISDGMVAANMKLERIEARAIWNELIKLGYRRVHDVESSLNQRSLDDSFRVFKIRSKTTGLYSDGGTPVLWSNKGKTWNQINHLKAHFKILTKRNKNMPDYENAEIVELGERRALDVKDFKDLKVK